MQLGLFTRDPTRFLYCHETVRAFSWVRTPKIRRADGLFFNLSGHHDGIYDTNADYVQSPQFVDRMECFRMDADPWAVLCDTLTGSHCPTEPEQLQQLQLQQSQLQLQPPANGDHEALR